jgi:hypothetical protein
MCPRGGRGSVLFFGGVTLIVVDWCHDFRLSWPAMVGTRMLIFGMILLVTEGLVLLHGRFHRRHVPGREAS